MQRLAGSLLIFMSLIILNVTGYAKTSLAVNIEGVSNSLANTLKQQLEILKYKDYALKSDDKLKILYNSGISNITKALKPLGYYQSRVKSQLQYDKNHDQWHVNYSVHLGPAIMIKALNLNLQGEGKNNPDFLAIIKNTSLKTQHAFNQYAYETLKKSLLNTANDQGYFQATFTKKNVLVDIKANTVVINLTLDTRKRYRFGKIVFKQKGFQFSKDFLQKFVPFAKGQQYNINDIHKLDANFQRSNYFSSINVKTIPIAKTQSVKVMIHLRAEKSQQYLFGIGYGSETKARGTLGVTFPHITKTGQSFKAFVQIAEIYTRFYLDYLIPGKNPLDDYYNLIVARTRTDITPYYALSNLVGINYTTKIHQWVTSFGLNGENIKFNPAGGTQIKQHYLMPMASIAYANKHPAGYFEQGISLSDTLSGAFKKVLASTTFVKNTLSMNASISLNENNRFFMNTLVGALHTNHLSTLSPTLRYYAGGVGLVRGFGYKSQGPTDTNGNLIGGKYLLVGSANFEHHLFGNWSALLYYDIGNAFNNIQHIDAKRGVGVGISWRSILGPIDLYATKPLDHTNHWHFDLNVGVNF